MESCTETPRGRKFSPEHAEARKKLRLTAARVIRAVIEGCIALEESAVVDGKLFIRHRSGRYTMIEPESKKRIGIVDNTNGDGYVDGIVHENVYYFTEVMEGWLKN